MAQDGGISKHYNDLIFYDTAVLMLYQTIFLQ